MRGEFVQLHNLVLRKLAQWKFIEWKPDYYNDKEKEYYDWITEERRKLEEERMKEEQERKR